MEIKVLGTGHCTRCATLFERTKEAVAALNLDANVTKIEDMEQIMKYDLMSLPAIVIDEKVAGRGLLSTEEVKDILREASER